MNLGRVVSRGLGKIAIAALLPAIAIGLYVLLAENRGCVELDVDKLPLRIVESGAYCLDSTVYLRDQGPAITIEAPNVVLDMSGAGISGAKEVVGQRGLVVSSGVDSVRIYGGELKDLDYAIIAQDVSNLFVGNLLIENVNTFGVLSSGVDHKFSGITFRNVGAGNDSTSEEAYAVALQSNSRNLVVENNKFLQIKRQPLDSSVTGEAVGILLPDGSSNINISKNVFENLSVEDRVIGIWGRSADVRIDSNVFLNIPWPVWGLYSKDFYFLSNHLDLKWVDGYGSVTEGGYPRVGVEVKLSNPEDVELMGNSFSDFFCAFVISGEKPIRFKFLENSIHLRDDLTIDNRCRNPLAVANKEGGFFMNHEGRDGVYLDLVRRAND